MRWQPPQPQAPQMCPPGRPCQLSCCMARPRSLHRSTAGTFCRCCQPFQSSVSPGTPPHHTGCRICTHRSHLRGSLANRCRRSLLESCRRCMLRRHCRPQRTWSLLPHTGPRNSGRPGPSPLPHRTPAARTCPPGKRRSPQRLYLVSQSLDAESCRCTLPQRPAGSPIPAGGCGVIPSRSSSWLRCSSLCRKKSSDLGNRMRINASVRSYQSRPA
mmetsp:Transcript_28470/g.80327  ORF Transcript_28470/g.80327 Transcript_28470/m.80327 type:complete len:215 (-) Transcript_28470:46-690(-)